MNFHVPTLALLCCIMSTVDNPYARLIVRLGSIAIIISFVYEQLHTEPYQQMVQMAHNVRFRNQNNPKSNLIEPIDESLID